MCFILCILCTVCVNVYYCHRLSTQLHLNNNNNNIRFYLSQRSRSLTFWSTAARLLGLWVRIPQEHEFISRVIVVFSGSGLWDEPITRTNSPTDCGVSQCDSEVSSGRQLWLNSACGTIKKEM
jgi:hypothetical protein